MTIDDLFDWMLRIAQKYKLIKTERFYVEAHGKYEVRIMRRSEAGK